MGKEGRREIGRQILFLKGRRSYEWPALSPWMRVCFLIAALLTLGVAGRLRHRRFKTRGEISVRPFIRKSDYEADLAQSPGLAGAG